MSAIIDKLTDLLEQATVERTHYYVAGACREAIAHITLIESQRDLAALRCDRASKALRDIVSWCEDRERTGLVDPELRSFAVGIKRLAKDGLG